jgi:hypothetical protein
MCVCCACVHVFNTPLHLAGLSMTLPSPYSQRQQVRVRTVCVVTRKCACARTDALAVAFISNCGGSNGAVMCDVMCGVGVCACGV